MSGSTARKVQPFTISTRLSLPKCAAEFPGDACPGIALASALDSHRGLRRSINERISLYLAHARAAPAGQPRSPSPGEDGGTEEERLNRSSLARSIKKITLSNWYGDSGTGEAAGAGDPARAGGERNHNNNNSRTGKAQFKVKRCRYPVPGSRPVFPAVPRSSLPRDGEVPERLPHPGCLIPMPSRQQSLQGSWGSCFSPHTPVSHQAGGREAFAGERR